MGEGKLHLSVLGQEEMSGSFRHKQWNFGYHKIFVREKFCGLRLVEVLEIPFQVKIFVQLIRICWNVVLPVAYRGGVWGVQTPPQLPKISVESSIAWARRTGDSISFC